MADPKLSAPPAGSPAAIGTAAYSMNGAPGPQGGQPAPAPEVETGQGDGAQWGEDISTAEPGGSGRPWYRDPAYLGGLVAGTGLVLLLASRWNRVRAQQAAEEGAVRPCKCCGQLVRFDGTRWAAVDTYPDHRTSEPVPDSWPAQTPTPAAPTPAAPTPAASGTFDPAPPPPPTMTSQPVGEPLDAPIWERDPQAALQLLSETVGVAQPMAAPANLTDTPA